MFALAQHTFTTPKGNPARMMLRTDLAGNLSGFSDWNTVSSVMQPHDEYGLAEIAISGRAADIGAHIGSVTIALLLDNPGLTVIAIEPVPPNLDLLRVNLDANGLTDRCEVWDGAAGSGKTTTIRYGASHDESALHHAYIGNSALVYPGKPEQPHEEAQVKVFGPRDLGALDFIKIDCEGGEWSFFARGLPDAPLIVGEAHSVGGKRGDDIVSVLPGYEVTLSGNRSDIDAGGTCGFRAVRR